MLELPLSVQLLHPLLSGLGSRGLSALLSPPGPAPTPAPRLPPGLAPPCPGKFPRCLHRHPSSGLGRLCLRKDGGGVRIAWEDGSQMGTARGMPSSLARKPGSLLERVFPGLPGGRSTEQPPPVLRSLPSGASLPSALGPWVSVRALSGGAGTAGGVPDCH